MDGDDVGTGLGEVCNAELGLDNHQVTIQGLVSHGTQGIYHEWPDGDVGDKPAVHDVDVDPIAAGLIDGLDLQNFLMFEKGRSEARERGKYVYTATGQLLRKAAY